MDKVIIALGSNLGDRLGTLQKAAGFLQGLSEDAVIKSSIWESEPVGAAKFTFYNCAASITTTLEPLELLGKLKQFEQHCGREKNPERWGPRILDLDIIAFGNLVMQTDSLIIPHPEYTQRLFVLMPLREIDENWADPQTGCLINHLIEKAPDLNLHKTDLTW